MDSDQQRSTTMRKTTTNQQTINNNEHTSTTNSNNAATNQHKSATVSHFQLQQMEKQNGNLQQTINKAHPQPTNINTNKPKSAKSDNT